jgi:outer membrane PBP1 activator LpoA protein
MLHPRHRIAQTLLLATVVAWLLAACAPLQREPEPDAGEVARAALAEARQALIEGRAEAALLRLAALPAGTADPEARAILELRAEAAFAARQPDVGVAALVQRERMLEAPADRAANQRRIWSRMQEATAAGVTLETPAGTDPVTAGWLALGRIAAASGGNLFRLRAGLEEWRAVHPWHPAAPGLVDGLLADYRAMTEYPAQIALLLPLGGRQSGAAAAVRDGFIAAYLADESEGERPAVVVYDTVALGAVAAYEMAVRNGAEFVVGPLLKSELAELAVAERPLAPGLALNWTDDGLALPGYLAQFALAPEEEAAAAAERAVREGHRRALVLGQDTDQGRRTAESFIAAFQAGGGEVLGWQVYDPRENDFSTEIRALLLLDESRARHQQMQALLGRRLEYEPRRRQDADLVFLAARASEAVLLRLQLRFHYASELPVYATSLVYDATRERQDDLEGVLFPDMPWRVGAVSPEVMAPFRAFGQGAVEHSGRLFAFGADAYRLLPVLYHGGTALSGGMQGLTGDLSLDADGRVRRGLAWGRFIAGEVRHDPPPVDLEPLPAPDDGAGTMPGGIEERVPATPPAGSRTQP